MGFDDVTLYSSQMHTIRAIGLSGDVNLTDLANKLGITKAGVTKFVNKLQTYGLLINSPKQIIKRKYTLG